MDPRLDTGGFKIDFKKYSFILPAAFPVFFLAVFYFYPLAEIFKTAFFSASGSGDNFLPGLSWPISYYAGVAWFTFWQAALSTVLTLCAALPAAYVFASYRFRGKKILEALATVPFVLPTVATAAAFRFLLGKNGVLNSIFIKLGSQSPIINIENSIWLILIAHVFYNYAVVFRITCAFWANLNRSCTAKAARMLGAGPVRTFFKITLPLLKPAIFASSLLVFIFCFSSFGIILLLGGPKLATIEVEIYRQAVNIFDLRTAAFLSVIQIVFTFSLSFVYTRLQRKSALEIETGIGTFEPVSPKTLKDIIIVGLTVCFILAFLCSPVFALLAGSFWIDGSFSAVFYKALFKNPSQSIFFVSPVKAASFSAAFAVISTICAITTGLCAAIALSAKKKSLLASALDPVFMLPLSTSAVTLGLGFIIALDSPPLNLRSSFLIVPIAHTLAAFPFAVRSILPALSSIPQNIKYAAYMLGASKFYIFKKVVLPIAGPSIAAAAIFVFIISMGEFGATSFLALPDMPTMPVAIYSFLTRPGSINYGQAMAMSSLLIAITCVCFIFIEKFGRFKF